MVLAKTPLRVSFFGGGTDFPEFFQKHGGAVLGTAIDKYIYHTVIPFQSRLFEYSIRIAYSKVECVKSVDEIAHLPFRAVLKHLGIERDIEISITSDLPSFSGLGSSSSFVVGLLNSLLAQERRVLPGMELALEAIGIERDVLREVVGCQDQVFAAVGGLNLIEFAQAGNIVVHRIPISMARHAELESSLLLFYTGIRRAASKIEEKKINNLDAITDHLLEMRRLVDKAYTILTGNGSLARFGELLGENWKIKRSLAAEVSNGEIDSMYSKALEAGALGGKILGAGGGGFLLLFVPAESRETVRTALGEYHEIKFSIDAPGSHIVHC
jgi:D-glycero-alpha-D-manno-heptose-7-phosphate kinase